MSAVSYHVVPRQDNVMWTLNKKKQNKTVYPIMTEMMQGELENRRILANKIIQN